ncbi:hypothetical protein HO133_005129 [Letharia lupina]|uniref:F-box domain-containing protein n=1 Tax=Letharia lupina TaxID=560253 RepID=A0A8H6F987_9LECA|nr:uncharacterized protein HO133_005129 [Letharia lupina]KAF6219304.1 hypothetical protein HO133_005129 [Letharia lupina]
MAFTLSELPTEVLHQIISYLPPSSVPTLQTVSRKFNDFPQPLLWRDHCRTHFKYWSPEHSFQQKLSGAVVETDWKKLFSDRYSVDRSITRDVDGILASQRNRIEKAERIMGHGYDAKDALLRHLNVGDHAEDVLARRFYSDAVLGGLHRSMAVREWAKLNDGDVVPLERALAAFDMFVLHERDGDFHDVATRLDGIAQQYCSENPENMDQSPQQKAIALAEFLRQHDLTGISSNSHYHDLQNNFIGIALQDGPHPSLPLVSVAIYCCVAQRLGIDAQPCGFPFHVLAIIKPSPGRTLDGRHTDPGTSSEPMYMDPFRSSQEVYVKDLRAQLQSLGISPANFPELLGASSTAEIIRRCAKNIITSLQAIPRDHSAGHSYPDVDGAFYAAVWAVLLLPEGGTITAGAQRANCLSHITELIEKYFLTDTWLIEKYIPPMIEDRIQHEQSRNTIRVIRTTDHMPKTVKDRTSDSVRNVQYKVGQIFHHKRYHYKAVITGWDVECAATDDWMAHMRVHELPGGKHQGFYHVLGEDKSVRYVAEENIALVQDDPGKDLMVLAGQHFKRWDRTNGIFVSNIKDEYPDD